MDIYSFINSRDIAVHCRSLNHQFTPLEMAYLVWQSEKSMSEKHGAWQWIIDTQEDVEIAERYWTTYYKSLHQFLMDYMSIERKLIEKFKLEESGSVYEHSKCFAEDGTVICNEQGGFVSFHAVLEQIRHLNQKYCINEAKSRIKKIHIKKIWLDKKDIQSAGVAVSLAGEPVVSCYFTNTVKSEILNEEEDQIYNKTFQGMWIEVPVPFKKGDIVISNKKYDPNKKEPMILEHLCYWPQGDWFTRERIEKMSKDWDQTDMYVSVYGTSETGLIWSDHYISYLDIEYYHKKPEGKDRILKVLSSHIKKPENTSLEYLLNTYVSFLCDEYIQSGRKHLGYNYEWEETHLESD